MIGVRECFHWIIFPASVRKGEKNEGLELAVLAAAFLVSVCSPPMRFYVPAIMDDTVEGLPRTCSMRLMPGK